MPSIGFGEILVILVVALIVFGPRKLPEVSRTIGKSVREFRRATTNLRQEFEASVDDEDLPPTVESPYQRRQREAAAREADPPEAAPEPRDAGDTAG
jgi:sec-independent protein translocase protein TatA